MNLLLEKSMRYVDNIINNKIPSNKYIKKTCENFLNDYENRQHNDDFDYYYDSDNSRLNLYGFEKLTELTHIDSISFNPEYNEKITYNFTPKSEEDIDNGYENIANLVVTYDGKYSYTYRVYSYTN